MVVRREVRSNGVVHASVTTLLYRESTIIAKIAGR